MANAIYPLWKAAIMQATANSSLGGTVKIALVDTGTYTYNSAHEFLTSLTGRVGTDQTLATKTFTNGTFDADNPTWTSVTGNTVEALVIYVDTGTAGTSRLVAYLDSGYTGLPVTPNGGNITVTFDAAGIFTI